MKPLRLFAATLSLALMMIVSAHAGTVVEMSGGIGCPMFTGGLEQIAAKLGARHVPASVGCSFAEPGKATRGDLIVLIGHSMGAVHAAAKAVELKRQGYRVRVIALDPLYTGARCPPGIACICYWQGGFPMPGAQNIRIQTNYGHIGFPADPRVQARVIAAVGRP